MSQKSCSATGPASRHSSKQGKEAKKETQSPGTVSLFYASSFGAFSFHILSLVFLLSPYYLSTLSRSVFCLLHFTFRASFLCAVSFDALSLHFAFRALPPLRYQSTPDSSSLRLLHFTFRASFLCAVSFGALSLTLRLSASRFPCCTAPWRLTEAPLPQRRCFLSAFSGFFPDKLCQLLLSCFDSVPRAFDSPPGCARPSSGQGPIFL